MDSDLFCNDGKIRGGKVPGEVALHGIMNVNGKFEFNFYERRAYSFLLLLPFRNSAETSRLNYRAKRCGYVLRGAHINRLGEYPRKRFERIVLANRRRHRSAIELERTPRRDSQGALFLLPYRLAGNQTRVSLPNCHKHNDVPDDESI